MWIRSWEDLMWWWIPPVTKKNLREVAWEHMKSMLNVMNYMNDWNVKSWITIQKSKSNRTFIKMRIQCPAAFNLQINWLCHVCYAQRLTKSFPSNRSPMYQTNNVDLCLVRVDSSARSKRKLKRRYTWLKITICFFEDPTNHKLLSPLKGGIL